MMPKTSPAIHPTATQRLLIMTAHAITTTTDSTVSEISVQLRAWLVAMM